MTGVDEQGQSMRIAWKVWSLTGNLFTEKLGGYGEIINTIYTNKLQHVTIENIETNKQKGVSDTQWAVLCEYLELVEGKVTCHELNNIMFL